jgi:hypothetical protein
MESLESSSEMPQNLGTSSIATSTSTGPGTNIGTASDIIQCHNTEDSKESHSDEMNELLDHQKQIQSWMRDVEDRIVKLETSYLEDTPMGNLVRGWEQSKIYSSRTRKVTDKERLFSSSSYRVWLENKNRPPPVEEPKEVVTTFVKNKKFKRGGNHKKDAIVVDTVITHSAGSTAGSIEEG